MDKFLLFLSSIRWQDVVDIMLNSYILFRLYALFRGTNVFRILIGIAFFWFFQRIAVSLGLILTSWAIQGITAAAALIIIVIFRNEIRSVLQAKTLKTILWGVPHKPAKTPIQTIVETLYALAQRRIGALIVFPGKDDLEEVVQSGTPWRGLVSKEMIMSIFWRENPVHDGAIIIQGDQVTDVGVILPLSYRKDLPSHYGTRHRAAAGLAEATDALVMLASEERGNVIVAKGSQMRVISRKEELMLTLREHLGTTERQWGYLRKEKLELAVAALVATVFITAVWFSFTRGLESLVTLEIPIEYMNRDPEMEIVDTSANTVRLNLSGSGALIRSIQPEQVRARLDLSAALVGRNTFAVTSENIVVPPGVILREVEPAAVEVSLDVLVQKELAVQVDWVGRLPEHLMLTQVKLAPDTVMLIGGKQILDNISTIYTEKVRLDRLEKSGTITAKLALRPASLKIAPGSKDSVTAEYVVKKRNQV
jgi:uncharacterized protein (TIGR00159 family)